MKMTCVVLISLLWLLTCTCVTSVKSAIAVEQIVENKYASPRTNTVVRMSRKAFSKPIVSINEKPTSLSWAFGLEKPEEFEEYVRFGFNTVWLNIPWQQRINWEQYDAFLDAAEQYGLYVIISTDLIPAPVPGQPAVISPYNAIYSRAMDQWLKRLIQHYHRYPQVIAWATSHHPDRSAFYDENGFSRYLAARYGTLERISQAWGMDITDLPRITMQVAHQIDDSVEPLRYGRPSLDAALYRRKFLSDLLNLWATTIRRHDPTRLVFTGALSTYRSIISVPTSYDAIIPFLAPDTAESDMSTHNVHAVDIARRANRFAVFPVLIPSQASNSPSSLGLVANWLNEAAMHGASGIAFSDWTKLSGNNQLEAIIQFSMKQIRETNILNATPLATTALLYVPFGEGSSTTAGFPSYGFGTPANSNDSLPSRLSISEPNRLFYSLRLGTAYGQVDYLSAESLTQHDLMLDKYSCILAPLAVDIPEPAQNRLINYVNLGGVLVADMGFGSAQADGTLHILPKAMRSLFGTLGIQNYVVNSNINVTMTILQRHRLFPSLREREQIGAFKHVLGEARFTTGRPWGLLKPGRSGGRRRITRESSSVSIQANGAGFAVFAPAMFWANFLPGVSGFDAFHGDLFSRRALIKLSSSNTVVPPKIEFGLFDKGIAVINSGSHSHETATFNVMTPPGQLYDKAITRFQLKTKTLKPNETAVQAEIIVTVPPTQLMTLWRLPIYIYAPTGAQGTSIAEVRSYDRTKIELTVYGRNATVKMSGRDFTINSNNSQRLNILVKDGIYPIIPHSKHHLLIQRIGSGKSLKPLTVQANASGQISIETNFLHDLITIKPIAEEKETPTKKATLKKVL